MVSEWALGWGQGHTGQVIGRDFSRWLGLSIYDLRSQSSQSELLLEFHSTEGEVEAQRK